MLKEAIQALGLGDTTAEARKSITDALKGVGCIALPDSFTEHDLENYMPNRRRSRGTMTTRAIADFATYTKDHAQAGASVFVDAADMSATAVLNLGTPDAPGHTDNRAVLKLKKTAAYAALAAIVSRGGIKQVDAAEFLEDWTECIKCFSETGDIATPKAVAAVRKLTIESMRKLESSEQSLSASRSAFESVQATSQDPIPTTIYFTCKPYAELEERQFVLRLGILTSAAAPQITLRIVKVELHEEEMANELANLARGALQDSAKVLLGSYAKS